VRQVYPQRTRKQVNLRRPRLSVQSNFDDEAAKLNIDKVQILNFTLIAKSFTDFRKYGVLWGLKSSQNGFFEPQG
jgi:hypothetical protein